MVTLTAGGRAQAVRTTTVDQWDRAMTTLLELAVAFGKLDALYRKRKAWCDANWGASNLIEREQATQLTFVERNAAAGRMMDQAERVSRLQRDLPDEKRDGLGVLLGGELTPYLANALAMAAARLQTTDLFAVMAAVLMEDDDATGDGVDDGGS